MNTSIWIQGSDGTGQYVLDNTDSINTVNCGGAQFSNLIYSCIFSPYPLWIIHMNCFIKIIPSIFYSMGYELSSSSSHDSAQNTVHGLPATLYRGPEWLVTMILTLQHNITSPTVAPKLLQLRKVNNGKISNMIIHCMLIIVFNWY